MTRVQRAVLLLFLLLSTTAAGSALEWTGTGDLTSGTFPLGVGVYRLTVSSNANFFAKVTDPAGLQVGSIGIGSLHGGSGSVDLAVTAAGLHRLAVEGHGGTWAARLDPLSSEPVARLADGLAWTGKGNLGTGPVLLPAGVVRLAITSDTVMSARLMNRYGFAIGSTWINNLSGGNSSYLAVVPADGVYFLNIDGYDGTWTAGLTCVAWESAPDASGGLLLEGREDRASGPFLLPPGTLRLALRSAPPLSVSLLDRAGLIAWSGEITESSGDGVTGDLEVAGGPYLLNVDGPSSPWSVSLLMIAVTGPVPTPVVTTTASPTAPGATRSFGVRRYVVGGAPSSSPGGVSIGSPTVRPTSALFPRAWGTRSGTSPLPPSTRFVRWYPGTR